MSHAQNCVSSQHNRSCLMPLIKTDGSRSSQFSGQTDQIGRQLQNSILCDTNCRWDAKILTNCLSTRPIFDYILANTNFCLTTCVGKLLKLNSEEKLTRFDTIVVEKALVSIWRVIYVIVGSLYVERSCASEQKTEEENYRDRQHAWKAGDRTWDEVFTKGR